MRNKTKKNFPGRALRACALAASLSAAALAAGCAALDAGPVPEIPEYPWPALEAGLHAQQAVPYQVPVDRLVWVQPTNKKAACRIPVPASLSMSAVHARLFWDGDCRDGRAYGLGRIMYRSDLRDADIITLADFRRPGMMVSREYDRTHHVVADTARPIANTKPGRDPMGDAPTIYRDETKYTVDGDVFGSEIRKVTILNSGRSAFEGFETRADHESDGSAADVFMIKDNILYTGELDPAAGVSKYVFRDPATRRPVNDLTLSVVNADGETRGTALVTGPDGSVTPMRVDKAYYEGPVKALSEVYRFDAARVAAQTHEAAILERNYVLKVCPDPKATLPKGMREADYASICGFIKDHAAMEARTAEVRRAEAKERARADLEKRELMAKIRAYEAQAAAERAREAAARQEEMNEFMRSMNRMWWPGWYYYD